MKKFFTKKVLIICLSVLAVLLAALAGAWYYWQLPKFRDVTLEFGTEGVELEQFLNSRANPEWAQFVTDPETLDFSAVSEQPVTLVHLDREETVTLRIQDTVAPEAEFRDLVMNLDHPVTPEMFVVSARDLSQVTFSFAEPLWAPQRDRTVTVVASDIWGNSVSRECSLTYQWLKESFVLELGTLLTAQDLLLDPQVGLALINQTRIDEINSSPVGEYPFTARGGYKDSTCVITVQDTTPPVLQLQEVSVYKGEKVELKDFLVSATDLSGEVELKLLTELNTAVFGDYPVQVEARDIHGNVTVGETVLRVVSDRTPPVFWGMKAMTVEKHSTPNYTAGIKAHDAQDGYVKFTYNASGVNLKKAGTYYVTYTAKDKSGNVATYRRKVTVLPDHEDTDALVAYHAARCGSSIVEITNYVRSYISYNTNWGGGDPVWYGFTNRVGSCYVHALCLQRLLSYHGYTTKLIWVTNQSHYWLIVDMGGYWRHIDATPSTLHSRYAIMTDQQRLETLSGRVWDTSKWPACE